MSPLTVIGIGMALVPVALAVLAVVVLAVHDVIHGPDRSGAAGILVSLWLAAAGVFLVAGMSR